MNLTMGQVVVRVRTKTDRGLKPLSEDHRRGVRGLEEHHRVGTTVHLDGAGARPAVCGAFLVGVRERQDAQTGGAEAAETQGPGAEDLAGREGVGTIVCPLPSPPPPDSSHCRTPAHIGLSFAKTR